MKRSIAVIEDNADNRLLLRAILRQQYEITEYASGEEGLEGLRRVSVELVLLDVSLPNMSGLDVLMEIRKDETLQLLPVVALTAHAMSGDRERLLAAGFDHYIAKPIVDEDELTDAIERLLAR
jgi:CheY-like chemotaxis protein